MVCLAIQTLCTDCLSLLWGGGRLVILSVVFFDVGAIGNRICKSLAVLSILRCCLAPLRSAFDPQISSGRVVLEDLALASLDIRGYNKLLHSAGFWDRCQGDKVLIFQVDSGQGFSIVEERQATKS